MPTEPYRVPHKSVSCIVDGIELPRVQELSFSGSIPFEDVNELANEGVVARIYNVPDITSTLKTWDCSVDTLAVLAGEYNSIEITGSSPPLLNSGQGYGNKTIYIGADAPAGSESAFDTSGVNSIPIANEILLHRKTPGSTTIAECLHLSKAFLTSWSLSWSTDGNFEQSYDFDVTSLHRYVGTSAQYAAIAKVIPSATHGNLRLVSSISSANGTAPLGVVHNSNFYLNAAYFTTGSSTGAYDMSFGKIANDYETLSISPHAGTSVSTPEFNLGDYIRVLYMKWPVDFPFGELTTDYYPNLPAAIKGANTDVYLYANNGTSSMMYRIQSIDISVPFDRTELNEIGGNMPFFQSLTLPLNITLTINVLYSDLRHWAQFAGHGAETSFNGNYDSSYDLDLAFDKLSTQSKCKILLYKSRTDHSSSKLLTTFILSNLDFSGSDEDYPVSDNATATLNFSTDRMTVMGSGI